MIFSANTFGPGFDSLHLHKHKTIMRNRAGYRLINDRYIQTCTGMTGFDSVTMVKGGNSGHLNGKLVPMFTPQLKAAA